VKILSEIETRVLGSLVEKELTTPDYYPLSLNALVNACNQKSNRDPAMNLNDEAVRQALRSLEKEGLAGPADGMDNRVTKFEHRFQEAFNFDRREIAILCELLVRGPQTPGELRSRAERMYQFDDLGQVQSTLQRLAQREPPVVKMLPRQPGTKEARYAHLLSGDVQPHVQIDVHHDVPPHVQNDARNAAQMRAPEATRERSATHGGADDERIARLENELSALQNEVADLKQQLAAFRKQFE
jgi:uncharacterized protein YceH (UPF0502 family)